MDLYSKSTQSHPHHPSPAVQTSVKSWVIKRLFGESHWCTRWLIELCNEDYQLLTHITEQTADYVHVICLVRLAILKQPIDDDASACFYANMFQENNKKSLFKHFYKPYPCGLLSIIKKLGPRPLSKNDYKRLIKLLHDKNSLKFLCHVKRIHPYNLHWLEMIPTEFRHFQIINSMKTADDYKSFKYITKVIQIMRKDHSCKDIMNSFKKIKNAKQLRHWFDRLLLKTIYPPPPWEGNHRIKPVTTAKELHDLRRKFNNCIFNYSGDIILGNKYVYVSERGPSLISINRDPMIGWHVEEMKGICNKEIPSRTRRRILEEFAKVGIEQYHTMYDVLFDVDDWHED